jgi:hypothetical protein
MEQDSVVIINMSSKGTSASDLKSELSLYFAQDPNNAGIEIKEPSPTPGSLGMIDPLTIAIVIKILAGSGAVAVMFKSAFKAIEAYIAAKNAPAKIKIGPNTLEIPGNVTAKQRARLFHEFTASVSPRVHRESK